MKDIFLTNYSDLTFLNKIKDSLRKCKSFMFSVSFIKKAGLILLENDIKSALERGVIGKLITSTYQNFTDIESLELFLSWMDKYPNFECHLDFLSFGDNGFHTKGYLFEFDNEYEMIVGSSNITRFALVKNIEWNISIGNITNDKVYNDAINEFNYLWNKTKLLNNEIIKQYRYVLEVAIEKWDMDYINPQNLKIKPNIMQRKALKELLRYRSMGVKKCLIVSATATGKTYLAAFDALNFDAKRVLFIVHRETILEDAKKTFMNVFGENKTYGLYTSKQQDIDSDFVFSTNIMMSEHLDIFLANEFDYIIFDECHHASSNSYQKIMNYFKPEFILGLTATPERMDNQNIFELFDQNVPFELRLRDALLNELVVPFRYYGIRDEFIDYSDKNKSKIVNQIASDVNSNFIKNEIEKHRPSGKLKAIAFCKSIIHSRLMAYKLQEVGYNAISLTGSNNTGERILAFNSLQDDNNPLEIITTVDILNEGVDVPAINMVLFLRPTESQTIFIQQLGRGLRKYPNKEYLVVLDFIGNNYQRSTQIALALGSLSKNTIIEKKYLTDLVRTEFKSLDLPIEIHIDELSKLEILKYIESTNFNRIDFLKQDYLNFKKYIGTESYPTHMDFLNYDCSPDLMRIMKASTKSTKNMSYYNFLRKIDEENIPEFSDDEVNIINSISDLLPLVRLDEYLIINNILNSDNDFNKLINMYGKVSSKTIENALYLLVKDKILLKINDEYKLNINFISSSFNNYLRDLLEYGIRRYEIEFGEFDTKFKYYANYYKEQILRALCEKGLMWMLGTKYLENGETIVFVGLKKDKSKEELYNYKDKFLSSKIFQWESVNDTTINSKEGIKLINTKIVHLFVRKMEKEDGITLPFTYFGTGHFKNMKETFNEGKPTLTFDIVLDREVPKEYHLDFKIKEENSDETL